MTSWTAPPPPPFGGSLVADERTLLEGFLDWQRAVLAGKCTGLTGEELARRSTPPSTLSLLGLVRHVTDVEREWFHRRFRGEPVPYLYRRDDAKDAAFDEADPAAAEQDYDRLIAEWRSARAAVTSAALDDAFEDPQRGPMSLRAVYLHLIQEYARHNGHADLLRQRIDGETG
ncbi:DinB family protein [Dactylosporangium roseum]|uniref:DinB family protein n=1 Tax=Dactylosporangium roseum TaxID=47989 RepID=A0ABY5YV04_9ACTN|nr:DinB family protein [Dactylosporangium roseum]UWZ33563.1 DinB family protein [Dactylosporangium roseum]